MKSASVTFTVLALLAASVAHSQTQGVSKTEIVIGTILDLSGPIAAFGKQSRNGMQLRVDEINEQGGINGRKVKLLVEDAGYDPKRAVPMWPAIKKILSWLTSFCADSTARLGS